MSYEESPERQRSRSGYRTPLDLGMGPFYAIVGIAIMVMKGVGDMKIPAVVAYVLGAMLVIGGGARFYRGWQDLMQQRKK